MKSLFRAATVLALLLATAPAHAGHDPNRTVTIYVHGFERPGADRHGVYAADLHEPLADSLAVMAGLPPGDTTGGPIAANAVLAMTYYGDTPPAWFTAADRAEVDRLTAQWGGGVPRYAYLVARYAQHALERSGADQVNLVTASFGSLITRWLIEKDVAGLAGSGRIARWLTIEGVLAGNWAASREDLRQYLDIVQPEPIDVDHMTYDWVSANLHTPRREADSPLYADILIGQVASTDDEANDGALTALMFSANDYQPNDGVQALPDARFATVTDRSRLLGRPPTLALFHIDHLGIEHHAGAFAQAATFVTARRRVTVTLTSARVTNLHEPHDPWWDWTPAEVVFESWVRSPAAARRWGVTDPLSERPRGDATAPLRRFRSSGETQALGETVFDDFVLPDETALTVDLRAAEVDYDPAYGVVETATTPYYDEMGGGRVTVSTLGSGVYTLALADWSCELAVEVSDYPFAPLAGAAAVPPGAHARRAALRIAPDPARGAVSIAAADVPAAWSADPARLEIVDVGGRTVRVLSGPLGRTFAWDGRDAGGRAVPAGVYLHRLVSAHGTWSGRSVRLR